MTCACKGLRARRWGTIRRGCMCGYGGSSRLLGGALPVEAAEGVAQHKAQLERAIDAARAEHEHAPAIRQGCIATWWDAATRTLTLTLSPKP